MLGFVDVVVLCCVVLHCVVLYCVVFGCVVFFWCTLLFRCIVFCCVLQGSTVPALQAGALWQAGAQYWEVYNSSGSARALRNSGFILLAKI